MKSKLIVAVVAVVLTGGLAYWLGHRQASISCYVRLSQYYEDRQQERWRDNGYHQARMCLSALTNLDVGKQAETRAVLEQHLSEGVGRLVSTWDNPRGDQFSVPQVVLLRMARDYRLQHPWTNQEPEEQERLEKAFKMLDAPDQVKRLENIDKVLKSAH